MNLQQLQQQRQQEVRKELMCEEWDEDYPIELSLGHLDTVTATSIHAGVEWAIEEILKVQYGINGRGEKLVMFDDLEAMAATLKDQLTNQLSV